MTDLLHTLPTFPTSSYTHLLPSLEKNLITTTDLLTLDALEIAKRAQLPVLDVRRLATAVVAALHGELGCGLSNGAGVGDGHKDGRQNVQKDTKDINRWKKTGAEVVNQWRTISTLDDQLDAALGGGIPTGYITEITGERYPSQGPLDPDPPKANPASSGAGKTQFLLTLLLSAQLPAPHGLSRPAIYISTEAPLSTPRLSQLLASHPTLTNLPHPTSSSSHPSLSNILTLQTPDLESQDHILRYQLPVALARHNIGLVILDSVAANYRAEFERPEARSGAAMGKRSNELAKLGQLLRDLARMHDVAILVANQVADRFAATITRAAPPGSMGGAPSSPLVSRSNMASHGPPSSPLVSRSINPPPGGPIPTSSPSITAPSSSLPLAAQEPNGSQTTSFLDPMTLDHQQRWFTGWGSSPPSHSTTENHLKTPALGLVWTNQIACRIALVKEPVYGVTEDRDVAVGGEGRRGELVRWRRWMKVVFAPWVGGKGEGRGIEFEIRKEGIRSVEAAQDL